MVNGRCSQDFMPGGKCLMLIFSLKIVRLPKRKYAMCALALGVGNKAHKDFVGRRFFCENDTQQYYVA